MSGFLKMADTSCQGNWEHNAGHELSEDDCLKLCKNEPRCKYAMINEQNYCYLKGNDEQTSNDNLTCNFLEGQTSYQNLTNLPGLPQKVNGWSLRLQNTDVVPGEGAGQHHDLSIPACVQKCKDTVNCKSAVVNINADTENGLKNGTRSCYMRIGTDDKSELTWTPGCPSVWVSYAPPEEVKGDSSCRTK